MEYWIWLTQLRGIGPVLERNLLHYFKTPKAIYDSEEDELMLVEGIGPILSKLIRQSRSLDRALEVLERVDKYGIKLLTYNDDLYPGLAKEYAYGPSLLYYRGNIREESTGVGIVGSRRCTNYGKVLAVEAATYLARMDIPLISGMAKGVDGYSHIACLKNGGYTLAFLGSGVDICYPKEHREIFEGIIESGAVISEYPPTTKPRPEYFPRRNALISSWSKKILVVEAGEKSGALITANIGKSVGRQILAPPHEIYSPTGRGVNRLIYEGADIYLSPNQLISEDFTGRKEVTPYQEELLDQDSKDLDLGQVYKGNLSPLERKIIEAIKATPKTIEEISKNTGIDQVQLIEQLSLMELEGIIEGLPGGRFKFFA